MNCYLQSARAAASELKLARERLAYFLLLMFMVCVCSVLCIQYHCLTCSLIIIIIIMCVFSLF